MHQQTDAPTKNHKNALFWLLDLAAEGSNSIKEIQTMSPATAAKDPLTISSVNAGPIKKAPIRTPRGSASPLISVIQRIDQEDFFSTHMGKATAIPSGILCNKMPMVISIPSCKLAKADR
jgi:hypothetical protein